MNELESARVQLFTFLYAFCGDPLWAGYLWEIAGEQVRDAQWATRSLNASRTENNDG